MLPSLIPSPLTGRSRPRPESGTPIDNLNTLGAGLLVATAFNERGGRTLRDDALGGRTGTLATNHTMARGGLVVPSGVSLGSLLPVAANTKTLTSATFAFVGVITTSAVNGRVVGVRGTNVFGLLHNSTSTQFGIVWNGTNSYFTPTASFTGRLTAILTVTATLATLYVYQAGSGATVFTRASSYASQAFDGNVIIAGDGSSTANIVVGTWEAAAIWGRALSAGEVHSFASDPYQLWQSSYLDIPYVVVGGFRNLIGSSLIGENPLMPVWM